MTRRELHDRWQWRAIPNCPGRSVLVNEDRRLSFETLLGRQATVREFISQNARDRVLVVPLIDGGVISYVRDDGSIVHTLNTPEGFARKLADLGITLGDTSS